MEDKGRKRVLSIRITVLGIFLCVYVLLSGLTLGLHYHFSMNLATEAAERMFRGASNLAAERLESMDAMHVGLVTALKHHVEFVSKTTSLEKAATLQDEYPAMALLTAVMQRNNSIYALYVGLAQGDFLEFVNLDNSQDIRKQFGAVAQDRWVVVRVSEADGRRIKRLTFFDKELTPRQATVEDTTYRPQDRPWYRQAMQEDGVVRTRVYTFSTIQAQGITYAMRLNSGQGVVGVDLTVDSLDEFLRAQRPYPEAEMVLCNAAGDLMRITRPALPNDSQPGGVLARGLISGATLLALAPRQDRQGSVGELEVDGRRHFYFLERVETKYASEIHLGIVVPASVVEAPYLLQIRVSLGVTLLLLLLLAPLIWYFANLIVRPIKALVLENDKIGRRRLDEVRLVDSRIKEVLELSHSILAMARAIKAHEEAQRALMDAIIKLIAGAIDAKSPYTGGHCSRVPVLAALLARAASESQAEPFAAFHFSSDDQWREFHIAAWLHDCGKVTTPEYVVDKATKLETLHNRIHEIRTRFEVLLRDAEIEYLREVADAPHLAAALKEAFLARQQAIRDDFAFVADCNIGVEFLSEDRIARLQTIATRTWTRTLDNRLGLSQEELHRLQHVPAQDLPAREHLLADRPEHVVPRTKHPFGDNKRGFAMDIPEHLYNHGELYNLRIRKGTLTAEERFKINEHIIQTILMLEALPFPEGLARAPEYAGAHHETLIGTGYPRRLTREEMSIPARIMAIADVFEALTASDRPYKKAKTVSQAIQIMELMVRDQHLDPDLFALFLSSNVHLEYARTHLDPGQLDLEDSPPRDAA